MSTVGTQDKTMKLLLNYSLNSALMYFVRLSLDCLIHGSVYEETESFFSSLEQKLEISANRMDKNEFREYISFKTQINDSKLGFTAGGFAPFNKSTFLSVNFKSNICFINNSFSFIYSIDSLLCSQFYSNISSKRKNISFSKIRFNQILVITSTDPSIH